MFGWEFPPHNSGGLGVACLGLSKALFFEGVEVIFVLPKKMPISGYSERIIFAEDVIGSFAVRRVNCLLKPYIDSSGYSFLRSEEHCGVYGDTLLEEVKRYGEAAREIAKSTDHDVIHAHDWLSFSAGMKAKEVSGKPLIIHVHATEFDRTGGALNRDIYEMEKTGMIVADKIIAVSSYTKNIIVEKYGIDPAKIEVVHNGVEELRDFSGEKETTRFFETLKKASIKLVLFVGRITLQKGPDYFVRVAGKVSELYPNVRFLIVGSGDMEEQIMRQAAYGRLSSHILFAGFLRGEELEYAYRNADVFVMPSVSEPFGLTALEAAKRGVPVIVSKQSGVTEVLKNAFSVDFWDVDKMAGQIVSILKNPTLAKTVTKKTAEDVSKSTWKRAAEKCVQVYRKLISFFTKG